MTQLIKVMFMQIKVHTIYRQENFFYVVNSKKLVILNHHISQFALCLSVSTKCICMITECHASQVFNTEIHVYESVCSRKT